MIIQKTRGLSFQNLPPPGIVPASLFYGESEQTIGVSKVYSCPSGQIGILVSEIHCVVLLLIVSPVFTFTIVFA